MLDSLSYWEGPASAVARAWLNQVLQRHDLARVLEPLLLLLLHPKTHRLSIQRVQRYRNSAPLELGEELSEFRTQSKCRVPGSVLLYCYHCTSVIVLTFL